MVTYVGTKERRESRNAAETSHTPSLCHACPRPLTSGQLVRRRSPGATKVPAAGSAVHRVRLVLEVAVALVDEEGRVQSCLQQQREIREVSKERSGGTAGLSARGLPRACPTTARRASTAVPWTAMPGSRAGLSLALRRWGTMGRRQSRRGPSAALRGCSPHPYRLPYRLSGAGSPGRRHKEHAGGGDGLLSFSGLVCPSC